MTDIKMDSLVFAFHSDTGFHSYKQFTHNRISTFSSPGLVNQQIEVCQKFPEKIFSISIGARTGILECHYQFRFERWNCTTNAGYESVFGRMLDKGEVSSCNHIIWMYLEGEVRNKFESFGRCLQLSP